LDSVLQAPVGGAAGRPDAAIVSLWRGALGVLRGLVWGLKFYWRRRAYARGEARTLRCYSRRPSPYAEGHLAEAAEAWRSSRAAAEPAWHPATGLDNPADRQQRRRVPVTLTWFLVAAIILAALYLRRFPLDIGGEPGWHPPQVLTTPSGPGNVVLLGPVGGGGPR